MGSRDFRSHNRQAKKATSGKLRQELKNVETSQEANSVKLDTSGQSNILSGRTFIKDGQGYFFQ